MTKDQKSEVNHACRATIPIFKTVRNEIVGLQAIKIPYFSQILGSIRWDFSFFSKDYIPDRRLLSQRRSVPHQNLMVKEPLGKIPARKRVFAVR
jgi:hypothetical protein